KDSISFNAARWSALVRIGLISMAALLDRLCVDPIVLRMRPDESDVDDAIRVVDPNHQPIPVASDVEHDPAVVEDARSREFPLDVRRCGPVSPKHVPIPRQY